MSNFTPQTVHFNEQSVTLINHHNIACLTAEDVGRCLGYAKGNERKGIIAVYNRHADEFFAEDTGIVKLTTPSGVQNVRVFTQTGCIKLGFFANTPKAKDFRTWAATALVQKNTDNATAWLIDDLQDEILRLQPHLLKLITYRNKGLSQKEMGLLLGVSDTTIRSYLKKLARLGFIDYTPNAKFVAMGQLGYKSMKQAQLTLGV